MMNINKQDKYNINVKRQNYYYPLFIIIIFISILYIYLLVSQRDSS